MDILHTLYQKAFRFIRRLRNDIIYYFQRIVYPKYYYTTLYSYALEVPMGVENLQTFYYQLKYSFPRFDKCSICELKKDGIWGIKTALIHKAKCFVYSDIIVLENNNVLYDLHEYEYLKRIVNFKDEILIYSSLNWCQLKKTQLSKHIKSAIKIGGMFGFNYYHFLFQILPKMQYIESIDAKVPILLDCSARDIPNFKFLIDLFNFQKRECLFMDYGIKYEVENLYYITSPNMIIPNFHTRTRIDAGYIESIIMFMRRNILKDVPITQTKKRVYISRRRASKRRAYNEYECISSLIDFGFEEVFPEQLSIIEQASLFNQAEIIVGPTGAAFSNLLFTSKHANVIILTNHRNNFTFFSSIASIVGCNLIYLYDTSKKKEIIDNSAGAHDSFVIDTDNLKKIVNSIINH